MRFIVFGYVASFNNEFIKRRFKITVECVELIVIKTDDKLGQP